MRAPALALLLTLAPLALGAQETAVSGVVFLDRNGNGARDNGEPGVADVAVSDQHQVVATGADGTFAMRVASPGIVFVSVPDGYRAVGDFWRPVERGAPRRIAEFPLAAAPAPREFSFIHASDTHVSPQSVERTRRLRALADSIAPAFVLITGDLVRDALRVGEAEATGYYQLFTDEVKRFRTPVWTVPGNHENFGIERDKSHVEATHPLYGRAMYHHYRGPDYYSFTYGGVHFVGLNTVDIDDQSYYGHLDAGQVEWLERDLARVPAAMPVVTFDHIPFFTAMLTVGGYTEDPPAPTLITINGKRQLRHTVANAGDVLAILRRHRYPLALGGHLHVREKLRYEIEGQPTRFELSAAIVAPSDGAGLAFTSGFVLYRVKDGVIDEGSFIRLDPK